MPTNLIEAQPPEPPGKYDAILEQACKQPRTFFRLPEPFKSYSSATYFRHTYTDRFPGYRLEFKSTRIASGVHIFVAAFPVEEA